MAIEKERYIKELYDLKHINDVEIHKGFNYEDKLVERMTSEYLRRNEMNKGFLPKLQSLMVWMIESVLVVRNFHNYTVDKHYNRHNN